MKFDIIPLFPSVVSLGLLDGNFDDVFSRLKNTDFHDTDGDNSQSYASKSLYVLDSEQEFKLKINEAFNTFKNDYLKLHTTDFEITTSWMTKTLPNGSSQFHSHRNSYYSSVVYFETHQDGQLIFDDSHATYKTIEPNDPSEHNMFNVNSFFLTPRKNLIVFFPSYLSHKVNTYTGTLPRYSLAINFFPTNSFGKGDSALRIKHA